jgi:hypothetical protein
MVMTKERWLLWRKVCYGDLEGMVRGRALVDTMLRAVDVDWVIVWRFLAEEMLRVTELVVRVVRVTGVAVIGRSKSGMLSGKSLEKSYLFLLQEV